jgi:adenylate cyclase
MEKEIERKFLVRNDKFKDQSVQKQKITQGYLSKDPERTIRIRITEKEAWITIKGKSNDTGTTRLEWEKSISLADGESLLKLCVATPIEKIRHVIPQKNLNFEVDEFIGHKGGLIIAEIELPSEATLFEKPDWLGDEVTGIKEYYNAMM